MPKILFAISLMSLLACGSGESSPGATGSALDTPPVSARAPAGEAMEQADLGADAAVIKSCIDLVASGDYQRAVPVCLQATAIEAENADVQASLAKAQAKVAEAASSAAANAAGDAAADALGGISN